MFVPCKSQERAGERFCLQNWPYKNWSQEKKSIPKSTRFTRSFIEWASGHTQLNIYPQKVSIMTVYFARWDTWKQPCLYNDSRPETTHKRLFLFWLYQVIQAPNQNPRLYNGYQWMLKYRVSTETQDEKGVCVCVWIFVNTIRLLHGNCGLLRQPQFIKRRDVDPWMTNPRDELAQLRWKLWGNPFNTYISCRAFEQLFCNIFSLWKLIHAAIKAKLGLQCHQNICVYLNPQTRHWAINIQSVSSTIICDAPGLRWTWAMIWPDHFTIHSVFASLHDPLAKKCSKNFPPLNTHIHHTIRFSLPTYDSIDFNFDACRRVLTDTSNIFL